jgi:hypothetical protein
LVHRHSDLEQRIREALADEKKLSELRRNASVAARAYTNDKQTERLVADLAAFVHAQLPANRWRENWNALGYSALVTNGIEPMAERCFSLHRQYAPSDFEAYNNLAYILLDRSMRKEFAAERTLLLRAALGEAEVAKEAYPDSLVARLNMSRILELLGDLAAAQSELEQILELTERATLPPEAYTGLIWEELRFTRLRIGLNWAQVNHRNDVLAMVAEWRKLFRAAAAERIYAVATKRGESSLVEASLHRAIALDETNGLLWLELGKRHRNAPQGLAALRKAAELEPCLTEAWEELVQGCAEEGLSNEAKLWQDKLRRLQQSLLQCPAVAA